jgi:hypothetical protein
LLFVDVGLQDACEPGKSLPLQRRCAVAPLPKNIRVSLHSRATFRVHSCVAGTQGETRRLSDFAGSYYILINPFRRPAIAASVRLRAPNFCMMLFT